MHCLRHMAWIGGADECGDRQKSEGQDSGNFWRGAVTMFQHGLRAARIALKDAEVQHRGYTTLKGFGNFAEA